MKTIQDIRRRLPSGDVRCDYTYKWEVIPSSDSTDSRQYPVTRAQETDTGRIWEGSALAFLLSRTSTEQLPESSDVDVQISALFNAFRDGFWGEKESNEFSRTLSYFVNVYGDLAVSSLAPFVIGNRASAETAAEALSCLAHLERDVSHNFRLWLMERALQASLSWIRDAATLGLEAMDDPSSIPYLEEASQKESNSDLRQYMLSVLAYLRRKR